MTISGYSNAIVNTMLSWLKGFANWVLRLFHLAGSVSTSPLLWLSHNWLKLLILFMVLGIAADILVWLVRWRPHWVWFRKERVIVDDEKFFAEDSLKTDDLDDDLEKNWQERDYVVASTVVKRSPESATRGRERTPARRQGAPSTIVKRRRQGGNPARGSFQRGERRRKPGMSGGRPRPDGGSGQGDLFGLDGNRPDVTDFYEDEVFNVNNLPSTNDYPFEEK